MRESLPTLSMLNVFETVLAKGGFLNASKELNLTAAAVSYAVKALENAFGVLLFERRADGVVPTQEALALRDDVRDVIERARRLKVKASTLRPNEGAVRILAPQAFASLWLLPRMADLIEAFPDRRFEIISWLGGHSGAHNEMSGNVHLEVRWANDADIPRSMQRMLIVRDQAVAVASPQYLKRIGGRLTAESARGCLLVRAQNWPGIWERWSRAAFGSALRTADEIGVQNTALGIQAAEGGVGIAIAHAPLIRGELADGKLRLANDYALRVREGYFLLQYLPLDPRFVSEFQIWIKSAMSRRPP